MSQPIAAVVLLLALSGCTSTARLNVSDDTTCRGYGVLPGSREYYHCRMTLSQEREKRYADAVRSLGNIKVQPICPNVGLAPGVGVSC